MKRRAWRTILTAVAILLLIQGELWADPVIKEIYYQKKTTLPYPAIRTFRFSLWLTDTGGTDPIWSEEKQVKMTNAYVKTYLGDTILFDTVPVDFSQQYWVQVDKWKASTSTWVPVGLRDPLGVVPYALYSESSTILNTDRWLKSDTNTFIGVGVVGAGNLTHTGSDEGWYNTAFGYESLYANITGSYNTASGPWTLHLNTTGRYNTASGVDALHSNTTGSYNTAIGAGAGYNATGNYNIYIGSDVYGNAGESNVIRIGAAQTQTYIAGIYEGMIGEGASVFVAPNGQLGMWSSSKRFKEDIKDMGEASSRLVNLHPVTFRYKKEIDKDDRTLQYGLIAEEVAEVYPELVQYDKDGEPFTVRYHELGPMLLNEAQKQAEQIRKLTQALDEKDRRIQKLEKLVEAVQERMALIGGPIGAIVSK